MKKLTFLFTLLLSLMGVSAQAQTSLSISDEPSNGKFADNTHWYLIKAAAPDNFHKTGYLSTNSSYFLSSAGLRLDNETVPTTDEGLWCLVGNETDGYTIYNKAGGTSKVLGIGSTAQLYDADTTESGVTTQFDYTSSTYSSTPLAQCVKLHGTTGAWWNNSNFTDGTNNYACKLGTWTHNNSNTGTSGNAYYFIPCDDISNASTTAENWLEEANNYTRCLATYTVLKTIVPSVETACASEYSALQSNITGDNCYALAKAAINAVSGKAFRIQNGRTKAGQTATTSTVLTASGNDVCITTTAQLNKDANDLWSFKANDNGSLKLYNLNAKKYISTISSSFNASDPSTQLSDEANAINFNLSVWNSTYFNIIDEDGHRINGESAESGNNRVNNWSTVDGASNIWKIYEATSIEVALNAVGDNSYATTYLPLAVSGVEGATAYVASEPTDGEVTLSPTTGFNAEQGAVLIGESSSTLATLTFGANTTTSALNGSLQAVSIDGTQSSYLTLGRNSSNTSEVGFFQPTLTTIPCNRAFFYDESGNGSALNINFGNVTAISNATTQQQAVAPIFDLSGRRVLSPVKGGIYLQGGKKFMVK